MVINYLLQKIAKLYAAIKVMLKVAKENSEKGNLLAPRAGQSASGSQGRGLFVFYKGDKDLKAQRGRVKDILNQLINIITKRLL